MKPHQSALLTLLAVAALATPCAAQPASRTLPIETCAGCFAYLVFPPPAEPESYAMRAETTETATSAPTGGAPNDHPREQSAGLVVTSQQ